MDNRAKDVHDEPEYTLVYGGVSDDEDDFVEPFSPRPSTALPDPVPRDTDSSSAVSSGTPPSPPTHSDARRGFDSPHSRLRPNSNPNSNPNPNPNPNSNPNPNPNPEPPTWESILGGRDGSRRRGQGGRSQSEPPSARSVLSRQAHPHQFGGASRALFGAGSAIAALQTAPGVDSLVNITVDGNPGEVLKYLDAFMQENALALEGKSVLHGVSAGLQTPETVGDSAAKALQGSPSAVPSVAAVADVEARTGAALTQIKAARNALTSQPLVKPLLEEADGKLAALQAQYRTTASALRLHILGARKAIEWSLKEVMDSCHRAHETAMERLRRLAALIVSEKTKDAGAVQELVKTWKVVAVKYEDLLQSLQTFITGLHDELSDPGSKEACSAASTLSDVVRLRLDETTAYLAANKEVLQPEDALRALKTLKHAIGDCDGAIRHMAGVIAKNHVLMRAGKVDLALTKAKLQESEAARAKLVSELQDVQAKLNSGRQRDREMTLDTDLEAELVAIRGPAELERTRAQLQVQIGTLDKIIRVLKTHVAAGHARETLHRLRDATSPETEWGRLCESLFKHCTRAHDKLNAKYGRLRTMDRQLREEEQDVCLQVQADADKDMAREREAVRVKVVSGLETLNRAGDAFVTGIQEWGRALYSWLTPHDVVMLAPTRTSAADMAELASAAKQYASLLQALPHVLYTDLVMHVLYECGKPRGKEIPSPR